MLNKTEVLGLFSSHLVVPAIKDKESNRKHVPTDILSSLSLHVRSSLDGGTRARLRLANVFDLYWNAK